MSKIRLALFLSYCFFWICLSCTTRQYKTGIVQGNGFLSKSLYLKVDLPTGVKNIQVFNGRKPSKQEVFILGAKKYYVVDGLSAKLKYEVSLSQHAGVHPRIVKLNMNGLVSIMLGGGGFDDVGLLSDRGDFVWKYAHVGTSPVMVQGDSDGGGNVAFYVGDYDGLHKLDSQGRQLWKAGDDWERQIATCCGDERVESIATITSNGKLQFWSTSGKLLKEINPAFRMHTIQFFNWNDEPFIVSAYASRIMMMDMEGQVVRSYELGEELLVKDMQSVPVKLVPNKAKYLAVLARFMSEINRAIITIFSPEGNIAYQEMLTDSKGIAVISNNDNSESLLIGNGENNVWRYSKN